ncbi:MAG: ABC transporter permease [Calditrichaeota bacterium]|nr:ABC transporter permease [Calditrichota bacterium]MCB9391074.1 ABC transporter permease [Calditrichota bacterium]
MGRVVSEVGDIFRRRDLFFRECVRLGTDSLPLVLVVGVFAGAVSGWQLSYQMEGYLPRDLLGPGVFKSIVLEMGPVLTGLVIAGRVAASIAAEIGTMRVTEQIDALESMAISSTRYLAVPRIAAMTIMMPILVVQANFIALMGAWFVTTMFLSFTTAQFWGLVPNFFHVYDIISGLLKSCFFGMSSAMIGCYVGFDASGGAEGVGTATIKAFVWSSIALLVLDYILAMILF